MDIIENGMVTDNVGLNFSEPDSIIGLNHIYDLSLLFLREYGPPVLLSSLFDKFGLLLLWARFPPTQVFLFLYVHHTTVSQPLYCPTIQL